MDASSLHQLSPCTIALSECSGYQCRWSASLRKELAAKAGLKLRSLQWDQILWVGHVYVPYLWLFSVDLNQNTQTTVHTEEKFIWLMALGTRKSKSAESGHGFRLVSSEGLGSSRHSEVGVVTWDWRQRPTPLSPLKASKGTVGVTLKTISNLNHPPIL